LLLGSERTGLEPEQMSICDSIVRLPMNGKSTSLNLSVAAGVLLYQMQSAFSKHTS
jgi:TrmH family RNA methyltransferase